MVTTFPSADSDRIDAEPDSAGAERAGLRTGLRTESDFGVGLRYVARQPILDAQGSVHGYELLFRNGPTLAFSGDGNAATRTMLDNTIIFGLERLSGGLPIFVNCTQESLQDKLVMVLPPQHTVLELLETLEPTDELWSACSDLKAQGYRLALDDFVWSPPWQRFLELVDYVKVDISVTSAAERAFLIQKLRGRAVHLVAERVETQADLAMSLEEGFTLFQGYYFCRPVLLKNEGIPANHLVYINLLHALHEAPMNMQVVGRLVKRDASLTYRLLRVVNSPLYGLRREITSIQGALVMIGDAMFRRIALLAITGELRGDHPSELLRMAYLRGRFCELVAPTIRQDATEQYLLGILSLLPAMLRVPMEQVTGAMPLRSSVKAALLGEANAERAILAWLLCYEEAQWDSCDEIATAAGLPERWLPEMYAASAAWAEETMKLSI